MVLNTSECCIVMCLKTVILFCALLAQILTEQCFTPNNETAECISLYSCPILIGALASQQKVSIEFVSESNCGGTGKNPMVCCGTSSNFTAGMDSTDNQIRNVSKISLLPSIRYCGLQHADDYYRTMNDTSVRITEFPWLAGIKYTDRNSNDNYKFGCVGSLINRRYVLTAAHCVGITAESVYLGEFNVNNETDCVQEPPFEEECSEPAQDVAIEKIIPHPNYRPGYKSHDIALIRLGKKMSFSDYIRPICLPFPERPTAKVGDILFSTGWHTLGSEYVDTKKKVLSKLITNEECQQVYNKFREKISENQLCVIPLSNNTDCIRIGDSGGPLMFSQNAQWYQEGIVSYRIGGCGAAFPEVYTKVMNYLDWILDVIEP